MDSLQELSGTSTLDDAMVIGAGQRQDFRDGVIGNDLLAGALEFGRVVKGTHADNGCLALG